MITHGRQPRESERARPPRRPRRTSTSRLRVPSATELELERVESTAPTRDRYLLTVLRGDPLGRVVRVVDEVVIGRGDDVSLALDDPALSWRHARVFRTGGELFVEDLGSTNGTFLGERRVTRPVRVGDGDRIRLGGHTVLKLALTDALEEEAAQRLFESTVKDALTSVHNRRYLLERLATELSFAERHDDTIAVLVVDIDHFKQINDEHGHHVGDAVLRVVAAAIQRVLRPEDLLARYGGDEFVVLTRRITQQNARILAERLRAHVAGIDLPLPGTHQLTVSVGLRCAGPGQFPSAPEELLTEADSAMYEAKQNGRNCVVERER